jgi:DNA-binding MarR family transcriptional regulator
MGKYISGRHVESLKSLEIKPANWKILDALREAYPAGLTAKELRKSTKQSVSDIYRNLSDLERENYLIKIPGDRDKGAKPSKLHIIEESSGILQTLFDYRLSPGNVKFSDDFKNAWEILVPNKEDETNLLRELTRFIENVIRLSTESDQEAIKNIAPRLGKKYCCKNCGINHEARDFIRAILIHLIDRLETKHEFVKFQNKYQLLGETARGEQVFEKIMKLSDQLERQDKRKVIPKPVTKSNIPTESTQHSVELASWQDYALRILSIQKDSLKDQVPFTATDKNGRLFDGTIDKALVKDEITADTIIEVKPRDNIDVIENYGKLTISINESIEVKSDDALFPKLSQLETKIEDIDLTKRKYILNGVVILKEPEMFKTESGKEYTWTLIGQESGYMTLQEEGANFLDKLHKDDKINIINVLSYSNLLLLSPYGSIEKMDTYVDPSVSDMLLQGHQISPPRKVTIIEQEKTRGDIKVTLHKIHILEDYTRLFVKIENNNENSEIRLNTSRSKAIQTKKQFEHSYKTDSRSRMIKFTIPPGVEEEGVLIFEPLDSIEDDVRFMISFYQNFHDNTFVFDVKLSG